MKCKLCGQEVKELKRIHLDDYNLDAQVCPDCFNKVMGSYLKEEKAPYHMSIEKAEKDTVYVDQNGAKLPVHVPKFLIKKDKEEHTFGLMSQAVDAEQDKTYYYKAVEITKEGTPLKTHYQVSLAFKVSHDLSQDESDAKRIKAYQDLKEKAAQVISQDDAFGNASVLDGTLYINGKKDQHFSDNTQLYYMSAPETAPALKEHTVLFPVSVDDDYFYSELFDIIITFSSIENFIPLDNVQKFALFYRKLLKQFTFYAAIAPDDAALQGLQMMQLLEPLASDDTYFINVCIKKLQDIIHE
jgi:hypothetical protein